MSGVCPAVSVRGGDDVDDEGASVSVRERWTRLGDGRGPPGTDGVRVISTGLGFGADGFCLLSRDGLMMLSFLVLAFLPREEKKPPATLDPVESGVVYDGDPITAVEWRKLMGGWTPASAG